MKRQLSLALIVGMSTLVGCKTPAGGGLAFWKSDDETSLASTAPDAGRQKYEGLAKEFGGTSAAPTGMGGRPATPDEGPVVSSWNKTTAAIASAFAVKPKVPESDDPTSLASKSGTMGPDVFVGLGRVYESQNKPAEAIAQYNKALSIEANHEGAMVSLARLHDRRGESAKAIEIYHKALKAHPKSALVHNDLGLCHARQKQFQRATESLTKAIALQPGNPKYRNNMATVMIELGRTDEAYRQLAAVNGEAVAHYNLAYLLEQKGHSGPAVQHLQQAIAKDPTLGPAHEMLAQLMGQTPGGGAYSESPGEARVAAQQASAPVYRQPSDVQWQSTPSPAVERPSYYAPSPSDQAPSDVTGSGGTYHIGDDIGPIQSGPAPGHTLWGAADASSPSPSSGSPTVEPLPPIEG